MYKFAVALFTRAWIEIARRCRYVQSSSSVTLSASASFYETDNIESLVAHEIGHAAHNVLALKKCGFKYGEPLTILQAEILKEEREKIIEKVYEIAFSDETVDEIFDACRKQLGRMAENPSELISQSFGNYYYGTTKSPIATKIVEYFKRS